MNKFKTTSTIAATLAVASALSGCGLFGGNKSAESIASATPSSETAKPIESAAPAESTVKPSESEKTETGKETGSADKANTGKNTGTVISTSKTKNTNYVKNTVVDPDADAKKACSATWGTWVNGTGCTWPVIGGGTVNTSHKSEYKEVELTPEQKRVLQLNQEIQDLSAKRVEALQKIADAYAKVLALEDDYQTALENEQTAKDALAAAQSTLLTNPVTLEQAKENVGVAEGRLEIVKANLGKAKQAYDDAVSEAADVMNAAYANADSAKEAAVEAAEEVRQASYKKADEDMASAKLAAEDVYNTAVKAAEDAYTTAAGEHQATYDAAVAVAKAKLDSDLSEITTEYNSKCDTINKEWSDALEAAQKAYDEAKATTADEAYNTAVKNLTDAVNAQKDANTAYGQAQALALSAQNAYDDALEAKKTADQAETDAKSALDQANANLTDAKEKLAELKTVAETATTNKSEAQTAYEDAVKAVETAKTAQSEAEATYEQAKAEAVPATGLVDAAQKKLDEANAALQAAQAQYAKGSLGFFEYNQSASLTNTMSDKAIELINANVNDVKNGTNGMSESRGVVLGNEKSATSLENMKRSMYILEETNYLRKQEGLTELRTNDHAMALSQVSVDIMTKWEHTMSQLYSVYGRTLAPDTGENLAAISTGYPISDKNGDGVIDISIDSEEDPGVYGGWYTREKAIYEYLQENPKATDEELLDKFGDTQTGHYANIISDYDFTGAAVGTRTVSPYSIPLDIYQQGFDFTRGHTAGWTNDTTMTVAEYKDRFMKYYNSVLEAKANAEQAVKDAEAAMEIAKANEGKIPTDRQKALDDAKLALDAAKQAVADAEGTETSKKDALDTADTALTDANTAVSTQETAVSDATTDVETKTTAHADAEQAAEDAGDKLATAESAKNTADKAVEDAKAVVDEKDAAVESAQDAKDKEQARIDAKIQEQKDALDKASDGTERDKKLADAYADYEEAAKAPKLAYDTAEKTAADAQELADSESDQTRKTAETAAADAHTKAVEDAEKTDSDAKTAADDVYNTAAQKASDEADSKKADAKADYDAVADGELADDVKAKQSEVDSAEADLQKQKDVYNKIDSDTKAVEQAQANVENASKAVTNADQAVKDAQTAADEVKTQQDAVVADIDKQIGDKKDEIYTIEHPEAVKSAEEVASTSEDSTLVVATPSEPTETAEQE